MYKPRAYKWQFTVGFSGEGKTKIPKSLTLRYFKTQGQGTYSRINSQEKILLCYILYRGCFGGDLYQILYCVSKFVDQDCTL